MTMRILDKLLKSTQMRNKLIFYLKPLTIFPINLKPLQNPCLNCYSTFFFPSNFYFTSKPKSSILSLYFVPSSIQFLSTSLSSSKNTTQIDSETDQDLVIEEWEEEDDTDPEIGDGGAGGGIVLQNVPWGEKVLSIAHEVLLQFGDDIKLFSFKTSPRGYIYVRLDKLSNEYGCPSMEEVENYNRQYKKRLEEEGTKGHIPDDLALEVSSPGAERLLRVPEDLHRFKDFPMVVSYVETDTESKKMEKTGVFFLDLVEMDTEQCVWKLADVRENRDPASKGRPLNRKKRDWRLKLPYSKLKQVTLYLEF